MERLKGKSILIGKDPARGCLLVALAGGGSAAIGAPGSVPGSVSRCRPLEGIAHARIDIDGNGIMTLTNLKPQNVTYVNGRQIESKHISAADTIELGADRFGLNLSLIGEAARRLAGTGNDNRQEFDISHLEHVWEEYQESLKHLYDENRRINLIRTGCGIFTMCAMPCIFFLGPVGYALTGVGVIGNIYSFVGLKNDNTYDKQKTIKECFQDHYICPNPQCGKYFGEISFRLMKRQYKMQCPHCKCKFTEKNKQQ